MADQFGRQSRSSSPRPHISWTPFVAAALGLMRACMSITRSIPDPFDGDKEMGMGSQFPPLSLPRRRSVGEPVVLVGEFDQLSKNLPLLVDVSAGHLDAEAAPSSAVGE